MKVRDEELKEPQRSSSFTQPFPFDRISFIALQVYLLLNARI
jgi:hypothetical protein